MKLQFSISEWKHILAHLEANEIDIPFTCGENDWYTRNKKHFVDRHIRIKDKIERALNDS